MDEARGTFHPNYDDRLALAIEWLNMQAELNGKGWVTNKDVKTAAERYATDDYDILIQALYRASLTD